MQIILNCIENYRFSRQEGIFSHVPQFSTYSLSSISNNPILNPTVSGVFALYAAQQPPSIGWQTPQLSGQ